MARRAKPVKREAKGKPSTARSPRKNGSIRDLEKRLADALRQLQTRNRELGEALQRQLATSEVLRLISRFQTDVQPVFDAIAAKALDLCRATTGWVYRFDGELIHIAAAHSLRPEAVEVVRQSYPMPPSRGGGTARAVLSRNVVYIPDIRVDDEYRLEALAKAADYLSVLAVPNVRLFKELEARTAELSRSVDQLTALGEVGRAVSSTLDLETVLTTIVSRAVELSGLDGGVVFEYDEEGKAFVQRAQAGTGGGLAAVRRATRIRENEGVVGRTAIDLKPVAVADITEPGAYVGPNRENLIESGVRAILAVPMVREGQLIGCLGVTRDQPGDFPAETIELLRTFAPSRRWRSRMPGSSGRSRTRADSSKRRADTRVSSWPTCLTSYEPH
jgi:two-component system, NtrC family, sensor kinase